MGRKEMPVNTKSTSLDYVESDDISRSILQDGGVLYKS